MTGVAETAFSPAQTQEKRAPIARIRRVRFIVRHQSMLKAGSQLEKTAELIEGWTSICGICKRFLVLLCNRTAAKAKKMRDFVKMNGLGNDFVILDCRQDPLELTSSQTRAIADRRYGVGCDQLIVLAPSSRADAFMRINNPDGSEVGACGNATRCIGQRLMIESGCTEATIETRAGVLVATRAAAGVTVDMGRPVLDAVSIPLSVADVDTACVRLDVSSLKAGLPDTFSAVNMGNPHAIFFVGDVNAHELERIGSLLENNPIFPERANISLVAVQTRHHLIQRVWERGAGLTLACGSGACAAVVASYRAGLTERHVRVSLPGGDLTIEWRGDDHVLMTGGVATAFSGRLDPSLLGIRPANE